MGGYIYPQIIFSMDVNMLIYMQIICRSYMQVLIIYADHLHEGVRRFAYGSKLRGTLGSRIVVSGIELAKNS